MKSGIEYFPSPSADDVCFKLVRAKFGMFGIGTVHALLQFIYFQNGYFMEWDEDTSLIFASDNGIPYDKLCEIVDFAVKKGIFDSEMYEKHNVLTSAEIQSNYFHAIKRRKVTEPHVKYLLINPKKLSKESKFSQKKDFKNGDNVYKNGEIADNFGQRIVEDRIVEDRIVEDSRGDGCVTPVGEHSAVCPTKEETTTTTATATTTTATTTDKETPTLNTGDSFEMNPSENSVEWEFGKKFNSICRSLGHIQSLTKNRAEAIREILPVIKSWGTLDAFFEKIEKSDFLCGRKNKKWKCTFDWIIKKDNAVKIMEGNFDNKIGNYGNFDTDEFFAAALRRSYGDDFFSMMNGED